jgi:hypothetical protein
VLEAAAGAAPGADPAKDLRGTLERLARDFDELALQVRSPAAPIDEARAALRLQAAKLRGLAERIAARDGHKR